MVGKHLRALRAGKIGRWLMAPALALIGSAAVCAPAIAASGSPTIVVSGDSVVATSLPSFGQTTLTVTRPDAVTGAPVVIGTVSGTGNPFTPFSANTTTPTPFNPSGDCWQKGALSEALTPDLRPGDSVTLTQAGLFGSGGSSSSTVVNPNDLDGATLGPIAGCSSVAPWARNAITSSPSSVQRGASLTVSGVAQPLATGVSVSASDGTTATTPIAVTPASDGSWTATISRSSLASLGGANFTVTPVFTVPDVSTGAQAHIAGVGASVTMAGTAGAKPPTGANNPTPPIGDSNPMAPSEPTKTKTPVRAKVGPRVTHLSIANSSLVKARSRGIQVSFDVPPGAHVVKIQLQHGGRNVYTTYVAGHKAGTRQTVTMPANLAKRLEPGRYTLTVMAGTSRSALGTAAIHIFLVTNRSQIR